MMLDDKIGYAMRLKGAIELPIPSGRGLEIHIIGNVAMVRMPLYVSSRLCKADPEWTICEIGKLPETIENLYRQLPSV